MAEAADRASAWPATAPRPTTARPVRQERTTAAQELALTEGATSNRRKSRCQYQIELVRFLRWLPKRTHWDLSNADIRL